MASSPSPPAVSVLLISSSSKASTPRPTSPAPTGSPPPTGTPSAPPNGRPNFARRTPSSSRSCRNARVRPSSRRARKRLRHTRKQSRNLSDRPRAHREDPRKVRAIGPYQNDLQQRGERTHPNATPAHHQDVKHQDVGNDRPQKHEPQGRRAADPHQRAADHLEERHMGHPSALHH